MAVIGQADVSIPLPEIDLVSFEILFDLPAELVSSEDAET
jgi:hypothetical protein